MPQTKTISKWALASAKIAYQLLAVSAEVFCRHSFGVRYAGHLVAGLLSCCLYTVLMETGQPQPQQNSTLSEIISNLDPALRRIISGLNSNPPQTERQANPQTPRRYHAGPLGPLPRITSNRPRNRK